MEHNPCRVVRAHPVAIQKRLSHADAATSLGLYGLFPSLDGEIAAGMDVTRARILEERDRHRVVVEMAAVQ